MIETVHPVVQALLGTLFTWGLTAAGAALEFVFQSSQVNNKAVSIVLVTVSYPIVYNSQVCRRVISQCYQNTVKSFNFRMF